VIRELAEVQGARPTLEMARVGDIQVDPGYQRHIKHAHLRRMVNGFDWNLFFAIGVNQRSEGGLYVFDGQHRVMAARECFGEDERVPAIIMHGLCRDEEARLFYALQTTRSPLFPIDRFNAQVERGELPALEIQRIVQENGFSLINQAGSGPLIQAVHAVERLYYPASGLTSSFYNRDPEGFGDSWVGRERLNWVLEMVAEVWQWEAQVDGICLGAMAKVFTASRMVKQFDRARFVKSIRFLEPGEWSKKAREKRIPLERIWFEEYNRKLPPARRLGMVEGGGESESEEVEGVE
jgi:hypothetical protein